MVACNAGKSQKMIALVEPGHALKTAPHLRKWGVGLRGFLGVGLGLRGVGLGWGCEASWACAHTVSHGVGLRGFLGVYIITGFWTYDLKAHCCFVCPHRFECKVHTPGFPEAGSIP